MKKKTKLMLGITTLGVGVLLLSGCTASFCSTNDKAHMMSVYDNGVTQYFNDAPTLHVGEDEANPLLDGYYYLTTVSGINNKIVFRYDLSYNNGGITKTNEAAKNNYVEYIANNCEYWATLDLVFVEHAVAISGRTITTAEEMNQLYSDYGYIRYGSNDLNKNVNWVTWDQYDIEARDKMMELNGTYGITYEITKVPTADYIKLYKSTMDTTINAFRGCITTTDGNFGSYGWTQNNKVSVPIEGKDYGYAWSKGFFEGLLVYPIAALVDVTCNAFQGMGNGLNGTNGWAQLITIFIVTLIVRLVMFFVSLKSTIGNAKMNDLQPQIRKLQEKYPNSNTNKMEKARLADEMAKLYKKNKINPLSSLIVMIFQFPIFICVWGAFTGSAWLSTGQFLGMNFSDSISSILFNGANWANGSAWTALVLFLLMAGSQVASMLIPQLIQKRKNKKVAKLGKTPAVNTQNKTMKIITWVMMAFIIFMGFSLASAMGVYWFVGALISIAQTFVVQAIVDRKTKKESK